MGNVTDIRSRMAPVIEFDDSVPENLREGIKNQIAETLTRLHTDKVRVSNYKNGDVVLAFTPVMPLTSINVSCTIQ